MQMGTRIALENGRRWLLDGRIARGKEEDGVLEEGE